MAPRAHSEEMDLPSPRNGASTRLAGDQEIGASHGQVEPVLGLRSKPRSCSQPRPQDRAQHGEADLDGSWYRAGTASPTKDDVGTVSSGSLGHSCCCRLLHYRDLDFRGSGHVLRFFRHSTEDPPGPSLDTHTKPRPSLHETSRARPRGVQRQLSSRLLAPHHRPRFEIYN